MDLHELGGGAYPEFVIHRDESYRYEATGLPHGRESRTISGPNSNFEQLVESVCSRFGRLDVLVNDAARTRFARFSTSRRRTSWTWLTPICAVPSVWLSGGGSQDAADRRGSIINISSCAARLMNPLPFSVCMAKGGLEALTKQLSIELAPHTGNAIAPGPTSNERNRGYDPTMI